MNDPRPAASRVEDGGPPSPKRKKVRSKYAPKACVSCRRSKLKCSGENPCQRCLDNGKRCFYSEDQTAAEALQNLSRPPTTLGTGHGANGSSSGNGNSNGHGRRNMPPRNEGSERRASDASVLGMSMEARMARIEGMMESLIKERGATAVPTATMELDEAVSDGMLSPRLANAHAHARRPSSTLESPERARQSVSLASGADSPAALRIGPNTVPFPQPGDYQRHLDVFFGELSAYYPCVNEADFRMRSERMLAVGVVHESDVCFLALHHIIFACSDIATSTFEGGPGIRPPGWQWFQVARDVAAAREISGKGDLSLIQYLVLKAVYLSLVDLPNAAYSVIGLACRLCFQFGLNQQSSWRNYTPFDIHMRQRIFWTAYFLDRQISLSCGRPYCIRESAIDIEQPAYLSDRDIHPDQPLPEANLSTSPNMFLNSMACWGRLAADVWDGLFDAAAAKNGANEEHAALLDAQIKHWTDVVLPTIPLLPRDKSPNVIQERHSIITQTRVALLRLYIFRQTMLTLKYDAERGRICGDLAVDTIKRIREHSLKTDPPSSFHFYMATALGSAILILATLCLQDLANIGLQDREPVYIVCYCQAMHIMEKGFSKHTNVARRIVSDLRTIDKLVASIISFRSVTNSFPQHLVPPNITDLMPYKALDFAQQQGDSGSLIANTEPTQDSDEWDSEVDERAGTYGVLWI